MSRNQHIAVNWLFLFLLFVATLVATIIQEQIIPKSLLLLGV
jgi:hypothetical protein